MSVNILADNEDCDLKLKQTFSCKKSNAAIEGVENFDAAHIGRVVPGLICSAGIAARAIVVIEQNA